MVTMEIQTKWHVLFILVTCGSIAGSLIIIGFFQEHKDLLIPFAMLCVPVFSLTIVFKGGLLRKTHKWYVGTRIMSFFLALQFFGTLLIYGGLYITNLNK